MSALVAQPNPCPNGCSANDLSAAGSAPLNCVSAAVAGANVALGRNRDRSRWLKEAVRLLPAAVCVVLAGLLVPADASARVVLVATGQGTATLTDVATNRVVARVPVGGRSRGVAVAPDGSRGYVAAGSRVVGFDLGTRLPVGVAAVPGVPAVLAVSADGLRLYAARPGALDVIDAATFAVLASIRLPHKSRPTSLAVSGDGTRAAVVIDRRQVAIVSLERFTLVKRIRVTAPSAVAYPPGQRDAWVSSPAAGGGRLVRFGPEGQFRGRFSVGRAVGGGGLAFSPTGSFAVVGANRGERVTVIFDVRRRRPVRRVRTGEGPGYPAWSQDRTRIYVGDRADGTVSVLSGLSFRRLTVQRLGGAARPSSIAVQPGVAVVIGTPGNDVIRGGRGQDRIEGLAGDDVLSGGRGNDVLLGGPGNDLLTGGTEDDILDGGDGDDRLFGQAGNDQTLGGPGNDTAFGGTGNDRIDGGDGNDFVDGGDGDDTILGGPGDDKIVEAGLGNDLLLDGGPGNDFIDGGRGSDRRINGGEGDDTLLGGPGSETLDGGPGNDTIDGGPGGDRLFGRDGDDAIKGDQGRDTIFGAAGDDTLDGGSSDDTISGGFGADEITAGPGRDRVDGGPGNDHIRVADNDADVVDCGPGRDTVYTEGTAPDRDQLTRCETVILVPPEPANDAPSTASNIFGTAGNDVLFGTPGDDSLFGGDGNDELFGNDGNDYVDGENGNDILHGGNGNDELHGRNGDDVLLGNAGDDRLFGERGRDTINGEDGNDQIYGGLDPDIIAGGPGNDRIQAVDGSVDRIDCGDGVDVVFADVDDVVDPNCEDVRR